MHRLRALSAILGLACGPAQAGIIFTPHLAEYSKLPAGQYTTFEFIYTDIEDVYDRDGRRQHLGAPFLAPGESVQATIALMKFLWIGNLFRDTDVWYLNERPQFCRTIAGLGWQQASDAVVERSRLFGLTAGGNGLIDLFLLCGFYTDEYHWGPLHGNGLWATTVKAPIGRFDRDALLNTGTHYWSYIPQFALHANAWGKLFLDATAAYHFHEDNDEPAYGGLTPTGIADWRTREVNLALKFSEHWYVEAGYSYRESVGPNRFDKVTVNFKDPVPAQEACDNTNGLGTPLVIDQNTCNTTSEFFVQPRPGSYADNGIFGEAVIGGLYYVYRTSSVLSLRAFYPISGRGSQIDVPFDVCARRPCGPNNNIRGAPLVSRLNGVQEAAAISASPYFELRFVYLFWAP